MQRIRRLLATVLLGLCAAPVLADSTDGYGPGGSGDMPWLGERKILGLRDDLEPIEVVKGTLMYEASRAIARVDDAQGGDSLDGYGYCTGARIGENLFLTNFHCDHVCSTMLFRLGYEKDVPAAERQVYRCKALVRKNETLDYAVYEAEPAGAQAEVHYPILTLYKGPLHDGQPVFVPSHPSGRLKEIDRSDECVLSSVAVFRTESGRDTMKHMCDTEGGSSGAPVLDKETGYAVGIHWGGKDGAYNMAVPMALILADLEASVHEEAILGQLQIVDAPEQQVAE